MKQYIPRQNDWKRLFGSWNACLILFFMTALVGAQENATNPNIWADVPDMSLLRVGDSYYMSSTTMHMTPGVPIMRSKNLVDWEIVGYAHDALENTDALALRNGQNAYGAGTWASSLRYNDGVFYLAVFSGTTGKTYIYSTRDVSGKWDVRSFRPMCHDCSLFFDDDGKKYLLYGAGNLRLTELNDDLSGFKQGGFNDVVIRNAGAVAGGRIGLQAEGSQMFKRNGKYYVCNITWPRGDMRTEIIFRADKITGPYEGRVIFKDRGIAQGTLVERQDGSWVAYLFRDSGAVGRIPYLIPVTWEDDWPVLGVDGKAPDELPIPREAEPLSGIVESDEFERQPDLLAKISAAAEDENDYCREAFPLAWQWNHIPDPKNWSLSERPGWLRLKTGRVDQTLQFARNTITQRTCGPTSTAETALDFSSLAEGDVAGLTVFQRKYGFVGVVKRDGKFFVVQSEAQLADNLNSDSVKENVLIPLDGQVSVVYLKASCDFTNQKDEASFFWSVDGQTWQAIGPKLKMIYSLPHFMGYRFGLFHYATESSGGIADFDYYHASTSNTTR